MFWSQDPLTLSLINSWKNYWGPQGAFLKKWVISVIIYYIWNQPKRLWKHKNTQHTSHRQSELGRHCTSCQEMLLCPHERTRGGTILAFSWAWLSRGRPHKRGLGALGLSAPCSRSALLICWELGSLWALKSGWLEFLHWKAGSRWAHYDKEWGGGWRLVLGRSGANTVLLSGSCPCLQWPHGGDTGTIVAHWGWVEWNEVACSRPRSKRMDVGADWADRGTC